MKTLARLFVMAIACAALPAMADRGRYWHDGGPSPYRDHFGDRYRDEWRDRRPEVRPPAVRYLHVHDRRHRDAAALGALGVGVIIGSMLVPPPPRTVVIQSPPLPVTPLVIAPPPVFTPPVPPERLWYYCESSGQYYPQVRYCPEGWRAVAAP